VKDDVTRMVQNVLDSPEALVELISAIADRPNAVRSIADSENLIRAVVGSMQVVSMQDIAEILQISYHRVKILAGRRRDADAGITGMSIPRSDALPSPLPSIPGSPLWLRSEVIRWAQQSGRLTVDGKPCRALPTGRPRKQGAA